MTVEQNNKFKKETEILRKFITSGDLTPEGRFRKIFGKLPSKTRCKFCHAPFEGFGGSLVRFAFKKRASNFNPHYCSSCFDLFEKTKFGTEGVVSFLFADVRGSTSLAEKMSNLEFRQLLGRFYDATIEKLIKSDAIIDKMIGDEVMALYIPGFAGVDHVSKSVEAAKEILRATGHENQDGPWIPVGIGVHTGEAYVGAVGSQEGVTDITALGDNVNIASRLTSLAGAGEVLVSEEAAKQANLDVSGLEQRSLDMKGKSQQMAAYVLKVSPA